MAGIYRVIFVLLTWLTSSVKGSSAELGTYEQNEVPYMYNTNNETGLMFLKRPPPFSVRDAGESGVYECVPNTEYWMEYVTVKWHAPTHVNLDTDKHGYTINRPSDVQDVEDEKNVYVSENNSLVFRHLEKQYRGSYFCELSVKGNTTAIARMSLHVIDVSDFNVIRSLITGLVACAVCVLLIFGLYFLITRLRAKYDGKHGEFELNPENNGLTVSAEKSARPMLDVDEKL